MDEAETETVSLSVTLENDSVSERLAVCVSLLLPESVGDRVLEGDNVLDQGRLWATVNE